MKKNQKNKKAKMNMNNVNVVAPADANNADENAVNVVGQAIVNVPEDQKAFKRVIIEIVGLTDAQADRIIMNGGIKNVMTLLEVQETDLMTCFLANSKPSLLAISRLKGLIGWACEQIATYGDDYVIDVAEFDENKCKCATRANAASSNGKRMHDEAGLKKEPSEPEKFNGKNKEWRSRKREALAYLARKKGVSGVPYIYLVRRDDETHEFIHGEDSNTLMKRIMNAPLCCRSFELDNFDLYQFLVSWTAGGTAVAHVDLYKSTQDGRKAWLSLEETYEGEDSRQTRIRDAMNKINTSKFERE